MRQTGCLSMLFNSFIFLFVFLPITYVVFWALRTAPGPVRLARRSPATSSTATGTRVLPADGCSRRWSATWRASASCAGRTPAAPNSAWSSRSPSTCCCSGSSSTRTSRSTRSRDVVARARRRTSRSRTSTSSCPSASRSTRSTPSPTSSTATAASSRRRGTSSSSPPTSRCSRSWSPARSCGSGRSRRTSRTSATPTARAGSRCGVSFFVIGLVEKVLVADSLAAFVDPGAARATQRSRPRGAWLAMLGYTFQLYFDFSGYSDMAVGLGLHVRPPHSAELQLAVQGARPVRLLAPLAHLAVDLPARLPLHPAGRQSAGGVEDLPQPDADHAARRAVARRDWTFVVWGGYHGVLLVGYRRWQRSLGPASRARPPAGDVPRSPWSAGCSSASTTSSMAGALLRKMFVASRGASGADRCSP